MPASRLLDVGLLSWVRGPTTVRRRLEHLAGRACRPRALDRRTQPPGWVARSLGSDLQGGLWGTSQGAVGLRSCPIWGSGTSWELGGILRLTLTILSFPPSSLGSAGPKPARLHATLRGFSQKGSSQPLSCRISKDSGVAGAPHSGAGLTGL